MQAIGQNRSRFTRGAVFEDGAQDLTPAMRNANLLSRRRESAHRRGLPGTRSNEEPLNVRS
jgi:hypothetical protein